MKLSQFLMFTTKGLNILGSSYYHLFDLQNALQTFNFEKI